MKLKNISKIIMSASVAAAPLSTLVSCGATKYDITVGIRPEEAHMWKPIVKEFEKATGKKVKLILVGDQVKNYTSWSISNTIPNVTVADSGASATGIQSGWFQPIDLNDVFTNKKNIVDSKGDYKEKNIKFNNKFFEMPSMNVNKIKGTSKFSSASVIYGPKLAFMWHKLPKADGTLIDLLDGTQNLEWYVPDEIGGIAKINNFDKGNNKNTSLISPLYSLKDGHRLKNNYDDIQEFMSRAIAKDDMKFNQPSYNSSILTDGNSQNNVISTGMPGYKQRVSSIGKVLYDYAKSQGTSLPLKTGSFTDPAISYANFALSKGQYQNTYSSNLNTNLNSDGQLDESKVFVVPKIKLSDSNSVKTKMRTQELSSTNLAPTNMTELEVINYLSTFGYLKTGVVHGSGLFNGKVDSQVGFGNGETIIIPNGAKWQKGSIIEKVKNTLNINDDSKISDYITAFGQPVQETGVDGYSISKQTSGTKLDIAHKFIRFMFQPKISSMITADKAISTLLDAQKLQPKENDSISKALNNSGSKWFADNSKDYINSIGWNIAKSTFLSSTSKVKGIYDSYNDFFMNGNAFDIYSSKAPTPEETMKAINKYNKKYSDSIALV